MRILVLIILFSATEAFALCRPRMSFPNRLVLNQANPTVTDIIVSRRRVENCNYFITFSRGLSPNFNRRLRRFFVTEPYNIFDSLSEDNILKDLPGASINEILQGSFTAATQNTLTNTFVTKHFAQDLLPAGRYRDVVQVSLFEGDFGGTFQLSQRRFLRVVHNVDKQVLLSLVDSGAPFDASDVSQSLGFGELTQGETLGFDIVVKSNAGFEITMSSQFDGRLKHQVANDFVDYQLAVNGVQQNLSGSSGSPVVVATGSGQTPASGARQTVRVAIGSVSNKVSGRYGDSVTVTVTTTE